MSKILFQNSYQITKQIWAGARISWRAIAPAKFGTQFGTKFGTQFDAGKNKKKYNHKSGYIYKKDIIKTIFKWIRNKSSFFMQ